MEISKDKINKIIEIKKYIRENKFIPNTIGEFIDHIMDKCSTIEKEDSFKAGLLLGIYITEFINDKQIVDIFRGGLGTLEGFIDKYPEHSYKKYLNKSK